MKRPHDEDDRVDEPLAKRHRPGASCTDRLSHLSHELTLRVLSNLDVSDLARCHRLSRHFQELAADSQLWKAHYYNNFVRPRASRIPGLRNLDDAGQHLLFSSKAARWVGEDGLVARGRSTNWKRQFKLRHNWSQGTCTIREVSVSEEPAVPPSLLEMSHDRIYMADLRDGLRAWHTSAGREMLARFSWRDIPQHDLKSPPTSLAVNKHGRRDSGAPLICIGFLDGSFCVLRLNNSLYRFDLLYRHAPSSNGMLTAVAFSYPLLATMTASQLLSIYTFPSDAGTSATTSLDPPKLLHSLHSQSVYPPLNLCIRHTPSATIVAIAFCLQTYLSGWTAGVQELHLDRTTQSIISSRLSSALSSPSLLPSPPPSPRRHSHDAKAIHTTPLSLTYSHPYLLTSHPDNTLTLYTVYSDPDALHVRPGTRLFGHASRVSGTAIGARGRAVSVAAHGDEVRLWDLERRGGGADGGNAACALGMGRAEGSVKVRAHVQRGAGAGGEEGVAGVRDRVVAAREDVRDRGWGRGSCAAEARAEGQMGLVRGWVGFDDESVVLLREGKGQSLVVYDFAR